MGGVQRVSAACASEEAPPDSSKAPSRSVQSVSAAELVQSVSHRHHYCRFLSHWGPALPSLGIREDMNQTLQQEQLLRDENTRLKAQYDKLNDPEEVSREAREQFGLAKPDEIPYKP